MSTPTAFPSIGYDLFALSSKSSQHAVNVPDEKVAGHEHFLTASEQRRRDDIDTLLMLPAEYLEANWNGEEAAPIPETAIQEARRFLHKLPATFPLPEVVPEPDGYLGLEWYANKWLLYVVSFNGKGMLSCSGLNGPDRTYGTRYMDEGIPAEILRNIAKVIR